MSKAEYLKITTSVIIEKSVTKNLLKSDGMMDEQIHIYVDGTFWDENSPKIHGTSHNPY